MGDGRNANWSLARLTVSKAIADALRRFVPFFSKVKEPHTPPPQLELSLMGVRAPDISVESKTSKREPTLWRPKKYAIDFILNNKSVFAGPTKESNWVIPGRVLAGAYPLVWDKNKPGSRINSKDLLKIMDQGVNTFVCLQSEYVHEQTPSCEITRSYIYPYIFEAQKLCRSKNLNRDLQFLHLPIRDLQCTIDEDCLDMALYLSHLLLTSPTSTLYVHCWGGHGRTGIIIALMLGLLYDMSADDALSRTQIYHDTRNCSLKVQSPQTHEQCNQVVRILNSSEAKNAKKMLAQVPSNPILPLKSRFELPIENNYHREENSDVEEEIEVKMEFEAEEKQQSEKSYFHEAHERSFESNYGKQNRFRFPIPTERGSTPTRPSKIRYTKGLSPRERLFGLAR